MTATTLDATLEAYYLGKIDIAALADKWGMSVTWTRERLDRMGLPVRPRTVGYKHHPARNANRVKGTPFVESNRVRSEAAARNRAEQCRRVLPSIDRAHWREVLQLRIDNPTLSLSEVGALCNPPRTKHSVQSILRRAITGARS
jgi:hypothetical protein